MASRPPKLTPVITTGTPSRRAVAGAPKIELPEVEPHERLGRLSRQSSISSDRSRSRSRSPVPLSVDRRCEVIAEKVRKALNAPARYRQRLTPEQERFVAKGYVSADQLIALMKVAEVAGSFSIRDPGGPYTALCIEHRAPAKGHDILEKTAKPKTLGEAYGKVKGAEILREMERIGEKYGHPIAGRVGVWKSGENEPGGKRLLGFYLSPEVKGWADSPDPRKKALHDASLPVPDPDIEPGKPPKKAPPYRYFPVDVDDLEASLQTLLKTPDWTEHVFGGDIDFHNLRLKNGVHVGQGSKEEANYKEMLNTGFGAVDAYRKPDPDHPWRALAQHGPQDNFGAHAANEERGTWQPKSLTQPDLPILAFMSHADGTRVHEITDLGDYDRLFKLSDAQRKRGSTQWEETGSGLKLVRSSSSLRDAAAADEPRSPVSGMSSPPLSPMSPSDPNRLFPGRLSSSGSARQTLATPDMGSPPTFIRGNPFDAASSAGSASPQSPQFPSRRGSYQVSPRGSLAEPGSPRASRIPVSTSRESIEPPAGPGSPVRRRDTLKNLLTGSASRSDTAGEPSAPPSSKGKDRLKKGVDKVVAAMRLKRGPGSGGPATE